MLAFGDFEALNFSTTLVTLRGKDPKTMQLFT